MCINSNKFDLTLYSSSRQNVMIMSEETMVYMICI